MHRIKTQNTSYLKMSTPDCNKLFDSLNKTILVNLFSYTDSNSPGIFRQP